MALPYLSDDGTIIVETTTTTGKPVRSHFHVWPDGESTSVTLEAPGPDSNNSFRVTAVRNSTCRDGFIVDCLVTTTETTVATVTVDPLTGVPSVTTVHTKDEVPAG